MHRCAAQRISRGVGSAVWPFLSGRMDAGVNILLGVGYTGQTTENFPPQTGQEVIRVRAPSYASVTLTYQFGRTPTP